MVRGAYIARYTLNDKRNDLDENILIRDSYWSPKLSSEFDRLAKARQPNEPMLQGWYFDSEQTQCMAWTNQPYKLS